MFFRKQKPSTPDQALSSSALVKPTLFNEAELQACQTFIPEGTLIDGAAYLASNGLTIAGQLTKLVSLSTTDQTTIYVMPSGQIQGGVIDARDMLICGIVDGVDITVTGKFELGPSAALKGHVHLGPDCEIYIAPTADVSKLTMNSIPISGAVSNASTGVGNGTHGK